MILIESLNNIMEEKTLLDHLSDIPPKKFFAILIIGGVLSWSLAMIILLLFLHFAYPR
jgi:hypothetical protein